MVLVRPREPKVRPTLSTGQAANPFANRFQWRRLPFAKCAPTIPTLLSHQSACGPPVRTPTSRPSSSVPVLHAANGNQVACCCCCCCHAVMVRMGWLADSELAERRTQSRCWRTTTTAIVNSHGIGHGAGIAVSVGCRHSLSLLSAPCVFAIAG
jgi:hypothetical protein